MSGTRGSAPLRVLMLLLGLAIMGGALVYTFGYIVWPGEIGVRQITFGPAQGFSKVGLKPGYHWSVPWYSSIHKVPQTLQSLDLHRDQDLYPESVGALEVQTTDGSSVDVDITVLYRFFPDSVMNEDGTMVHGGPADLLLRVGYAGDWLEHIQTAVINELKKSLGRLSTEQFYRPDLREPQVARALDELRKRLSVDGIRVESILVKRYTYTEERIDREIFEKNLQDQEERLNIAASQLSQARAELEQVAADWDAQIKTLEVTGEREVRVIESEADRYQREKRAEGDLLVAKAKAEVDRLKATALARSKGASVYIARETVPVIGALRGGLVTGIDPFDLEAWMDRFGADTAGGNK